jgi:hypothetical protein
MLKVRLRRQGNHPPTAFNLTSWSLDRGGDSFPILNSKTAPLSSFLSFAILRFSCKRSGSSSGRKNISAPSGICSISSGFTSLPHLYRFQPKAKIGKTSLRIYPPSAWLPARADSKLPGSPWQVPGWQDTARQENPKATGPGGESNDANRQVTNHVTVITSSEY